MDDRRVCDAHPLLVQGNEALRKDVGEIYGLMRGSAERDASMEKDIAVLKVEQEAIRKAQENMRDEMGEGFKRSAETQDKILDLVNRLATKQKKRFPTKRVVAIVGILMGGGGLTALITAISSAVKGG